MTFTQRLLDALTTRAETANTVPAMLPGVTPPIRDTVITPKGALALSSVYRAVDVLQTGAEQLTVDAWRGNQRLEGQQVPAILTAPDTDMDMSDLIGETVAALALTGNAYWLIARNRDGAAVGIRSLNPADCVPLLDPQTGRRSVQWHTRTYQPRDLIHLRKLRVPGDAYGLGPIQAARQELSGALDTDRWGADLIRSGGIPTGILSSDQPLTQEQASEGAKAWNARNSTGQGVAVLGRGLKYTNITVNPADLQWLESRTFNDRSISRIFGIPSHLMGLGVEGSAMTYQNIAQADLEFVRWTLMSYLRRIETALTKVTARGQTVRFNLDALLRADTSTRISTHAAAIAAGIYSTQYARAIEGINETAAPTQTTTPPDESTESDNDEPA